MKIRAETKLKAGSVKRTSDLRYRNDSSKNRLSDKKNREIFAP